MATSLPPAEHLLPHPPYSGYENMKIFFGLSTLAYCTVEYGVLCGIGPALCRFKLFVPMRKLALDADCPNCCSMYLALKVNRPMKELNFRMLPQRSRK